MSPRKVVECKALASHSASIRWSHRSLEGDGASVGEFDGGSPGLTGGCTVWKRGREVCDHGFEVLGRGRPKAGGNRVQVRACHRVGVEPLEHDPGDGAVQAKEGEIVVFSWIVYSSRRARDEIMQKAMSDPRLAMDKDALPFDSKRMIWDGFTPFIEL